MISLVRLSLLKNNYVVSFKICPDEKDGATRCGYGHPSQVNKKIYKINFKKLSEKHKELTYRVKSIQSLVFKQSFTFKCKTIKVAF